MHNTILPEYFHHGSPPKSSPTVHLRCQFFLHIRPLSRSWQLWHRVHPGNLGSRTEWQWCFHTWFVRVQVDYWGEFNLCYSISAHIILQRILYWITMSCISTQQAAFSLNYRRYSWAFSFSKLSANISQGPQELCCFVNQQDSPDVELKTKLPPLSVLLKGTFDPTVQTLSLYQIRQPRWRLQTGNSKLDITLPQRLCCKTDNTLH